MSLQNLSCRSIGDLDNGLAEKIIDAEIRKVIADLDDRGHDGAARSVTIELNMQKDVSRGDAIYIDVKVKTKLPAVRSGISQSKVGQKKGEMVLLFRDDNADNADQPTFDDVESK